MQESQTFPNSFTFHYSSVVAGYKMIVYNAVPVRMGKVLAQKIYEDLNSLKSTNNLRIVKNGDSLNGQFVRERMLEIVNSVAQ